MPEDGGSRAAAALSDLGPSAALASVQQQLADAAVSHLTRLSELTSAGVLSGTSTPAAYPLRLHSTLSMDSRHSIHSAHSVDSRHSADSSGSGRMGNTMERAYSRCHSAHSEARSTSSSQGGRAYARLLQVRYSSLTTVYESQRILLHMGTVQICKNARMRGATRCTVKHAAHCRHRVGVRLRGFFRCVTLP